MQVLKRQQRVKRLGHFHSDCELNYARLLKLIGDRSDCVAVFASGSDDEILLEISVSAESKYTRVLALKGAIKALPWAGDQKMVVRMYDDARMAEVISVDRRRVRLMNYDYPNKDMYVPDEKNQLNSFFGQWLTYMLEEGLPKTGEFRAFNSP